MGSWSQPSFFLSVMNRTTPVIRFQGPYVVSGGWWNRPIHREYHYAETQKGDLLWVFYDKPRRRWFLHGRVE